jgi:hypothetical protein
MLLEQLASVVAEASVERVELPFGSVINAQFVHRSSFLVSSAGGRREKSKCHGE